MNSTYTTHPEIVVPREFNAPTGHLTPAVQRELIIDSLARLRKAYTKHHNWLAGCTTGSKFGGDLPSVRTMPSKDAKHRMYGDAAYLVRVAGWGENVRCHSLDDIALLMMRVESILRAI
jgi:hypothetical protein